jgi:hypothetical protein
MVTVALKLDQGAVALHCFDVATVYLVLCKKMDQTLLELALHTPV